MDASQIINDRAKRYIALFEPPSTLEGVLIRRQEREEMLALVGSFAPHLQQLFYQKVNKGLGELYQRLTRKSKGVNQRWLEEIEEAWLQSQQQVVAGGTLSVTDTIEEAPTTPSIKPALTPSKESEAVHSSHPLSVEQVAQLTHAAKATIYGWVSKRLIPHHKKGKRLYFFEEEVLEWLRHGQRLTSRQVGQQAEEGLAQAHATHRLSKKR